MKVIVESSESRVRSHSSDSIAPTTGMIARSLASALDSLNVSRVTSMGTRVNVNYVHRDARTDEANRQLARLWSTSAFEHGWDGLDAEPPSRDAIKAAEAMIMRIASTPIPIPSASVGAEGQSNLYWKADNFYADVDVFGSKVSYFIVVDDNQSSGEEDLNEGLMPPSLYMALLDKFHP